MPLPQDRRRTSVIRNFVGRHTAFELSFFFLSFFLSCVDGGCRSFLQVRGESWAGMYGSRETRNLRARDCELDLRVDGSGGKYFRNLKMKLLFQNGTGIVSHPLAAQTPPKWFKMGTRRLRRRQNGSRWGTRRGCGDKSCFRHASSADRDWEWGARAARAPGLGRWPLSYFL